MNLIPHRSPIADRVAEVLREGISLGRWSRVLPGEVALSPEFQVSRMTLRAAIKTLTREGLMHATQGGRRSIIKAPGRPARSSKDRKVILLTPIPTPCMSKFLLLRVDRLREKLLKAGFDLHIHVGSANLSRKPDGVMEELMKSMRPSAWVLLNSSERLQQWFMRRCLPCVVIGARHRNIELPSIGTDYRALGNHAASQFLRHQHRVLAVLIPPEKKAGDIQAIEGFCLAGQRIPDATVHVEQHDGSMAGLQRSVLSLINKRHVTGLFVTLPTCALAVLTFLSRIGISVPRDLSLIAETVNRFLISPPRRWRDMR